VFPCLPLRGLDGSISRLGDGSQARYREVRH
jgi:hypothetical protein